MNHDSTLLKLVPAKREGICDRSQGISSYYVIGASIICNHDEALSILMFNY